MYSFLNIASVSWRYVFFRKRHAGGAAGNVSKRQIFPRENSAERRILGLLQKLKFRTTLFRCFHQGAQFTGFFQYLVSQFENMGGSFPCGKLFKPPVSDFGFPAPKQIIQCHAKNNRHFISCSCIGNTLMPNPAAEGIRRNAHIFRELPLSHFMGFDKRFYPAPKSVIAHAMIYRNSFKKTNFFAGKWCF